ncbi:MAG: hypothetical protein Q9166_001466 [cf. Caloplaca sp. 2 TL-2023]
MAILDDVEARVVLKDTKEVLKEYDKQHAPVASTRKSVEKYIEAKTGADFQVEVFIKESFKLWSAWGVRVWINIDGGVVDYFRPYSKKDVKEKQSSGEAIIFDSVMVKERSRYNSIGFRFGDLTINENIEVTRAVLESQAASLGSVQISVETVTRKPGTRWPSGPRVFYRPLTTTEVSKEIVKDRYIGSVMQSVPIP